MISISTSNGNLQLPAHKGVEIIHFSHIVRVEAISNYSRLYFANGKTLVVARVLRWFESVLPVQDFLRIHKTHLVNRHFIQCYIQGTGGQVRLCNGDLVNVAKRRKACFLNNWHNAA